MSTPIYAPAAASAPPATAPRNTAILGKDDFLQLLVTQLRNQDPMNPSDPQQMAAQLAQFSSLEQLVNINDALKTQQTQGLGLINGMNSAAAVGALGRDVIAKGNAVLVPASGDGTVRFELGGAASKARLHVFDAGGREVLTSELGALAAGEQSASFRLPSGLSGGKYSYSIEAADAAGAAVTATTYVTGRVDGIRYTAQGPVLLAGPIEIDLGDVVEISEGN